MCVQKFNYVSCGAHKINEIDWEVVLITIHKNKNYQGNRSNFSVNWSECKLL